MTRRDVGDGGNICSLALDSSSPGASAEEMEGANASNSSPPLSGRPVLTSHQSNSLPSSPFQRPRNRTSQSRSPSLGESGLNASPRSSHSDSNNSLPPLRRPGGPSRRGCKYETGMARARRRVPYSLGPEKLEAEPQSLKEHLTPEEDNRLSDDMRQLYDQLQPSADSEERRGRLMKKLGKLLNNRWPGHDIQVHVFGSSGNMLGTTDSDVDICITTDWTEIEHVCALAELLASSGMEKAVCVSSAKVPIVKYWDPELQLACDMNVNNTVALENTELIRSYVSLDDRVRPLAMIIKHWTRRRILNDAALGGTLSSYTWICMIINFLQTRDPPILPALQQARGLKARMLGGFNVAFDRDLASYSSFGAKNHDSLGELLFQFFRYYGHELDFEENVMSVRLGRTLPKRQKGWHQMQDNRLCVEEPFNISRNLGNTADDTSMRGIHLELRRAFGLVAEGKLDLCCEQYEPPQDENRTSDIFKLPVSRPVVTQAPAQPSKGPKNGTRGSRHGNQLNRGSNATGRRPSNPNTRGSAYLRNLPFQMTPQELQLHAQHQQHVLHDRLFQQYQYLQAQEQELRMQLHQQALLQGRTPSTISYPHIALPSYPVHDDSYEEDASSRASSLSRASMSAPIHQQRWAYTSPYLNSFMPNQGVTTNPPSPHLGPAVPVPRRYHRRTSVTQSSAGPSLRAQSQPPRSMAIPMSISQPTQPAVARANLPGQDLIGTDSAQSTQQSRTASTSISSSSFLQQSYRPAEYIGYYVGHSPSLLAYPRSAGISPIPSHVGLAIQNGGLSPRGFSQVSRSPFPSVTPPIDVAQPPSNISGPSFRGRKLRAKSSAPDRPGVPIEPTDKQLDDLTTTDSLPVHNAKPSSGEDLQEPTEAMTFSTTTSEDLTFDTPSSSDTQSQAGLENAVADFEHPLQSMVPDKVSVEENSFRHANGSALLHNNQQLGTNRKAKATTAVSVDKVTETVSIIVNGNAQHQYPVETSLDESLDALSLGEKPPPTSNVQTPPGVETLGGNQRPERPKQSRSNSRSRDDKAKYVSVQNSVHDSTALASKSNGQITGPSSGAAPKALPATNVWLTQKKKKKSKKAVKSENDVASVNVSGGESMPIDDTMRKGG